MSTLVLPVRPGRTQRELASLVHTSPLPYARVVTGIASGVFVDAIEEIWM